MAKKNLPSGLSLKGIAPNILISQVESTAPFIFQGEIETSSKEKSYLTKLQFYKKNLKSLGKINLAEYFSICMAAHWATAGTFVPTNVDNQIRQGLWRHEETPAYLDLMIKTTIDSWKWDYQDVTNRLVRGENYILSTHEGTWLSVAIGAYGAVMLHKRLSHQVSLEEIILAEIKKEEALLNYHLENKDYLTYLKTCALMAHNLGDLDRVIEQWQLSPEDPFIKEIYKLGHRPHPSYSDIFFKSGEMNKKIMAIENHRHMSMRAPRGLRKSKHFLIPIGPFMDQWGETIAWSTLLTLEDKAQFLTALIEGYQRQNQAWGYVRALHGFINGLDDGLQSLERHLPIDQIIDLKKSKMWQDSHEQKSEFEERMKKSFIQEFIY